MFRELNLHPVYTSDEDNIARDFIFLFYEMPRRLIGQVLIFQQEHLLLIPKD